MRITLKSLKIFDGMSRETTAFTATMYVDGKRTANVRNNGGGGCNMIDPIRHSSGEAVKTAVERLKAATAYVKTLPSVPSDYGDHDLDMGMDFFLSLLVGYYEQIAFFKKQVRRKFGVVQSDFASTGELILWKHDDTPSMREHARKEFPKGIFIADVVANPEDYPAKLGFYNFWNN